ncbi:MAG: LptF/LptG family permease [Planctomycetota bacterium]
MKMLDRYIVRSFLAATALWFVALMSLRVVADLFVNMDEFAKLGLPFGELGGYITRYYAYKSLVYFTELGGIIVVFGAMFTLARMNHTNELTAMLASGVSLHRVVWPIVLCSMALSGLIIADREALIPRVASELVRDRDEVPGSREFTVYLTPDNHGNARNTLYARRLRVADGVMEQPIVVVRNVQRRHLATVRTAPHGRARRWRLNGKSGWTLTAAQVERARGDWRHRPSTQRIHAALTRHQTDRLRRRIAAGGGRVDVVLHEPQYDDMRITGTARLVAGAAADEAPRLQLLQPRFALRIDGVEVATFTASAASYVTPEEGPPYWELKRGRAFVPSGLTVDDLVLRRDSRWMQFLSAGQLAKLARAQSTPGEVAGRGARQLIHIRVTEPINNLIMLLVGLPFILSRERNIKASAVLCLLTVGAFYVFVYLCRYMDLPPVWSAWTPLLVFGPITAVTLDAVKT